MGTRWLGKAAVLSTVVLAAGQNNGATFDARCAAATDQCSVWNPSFSDYERYTKSGAVERNTPPEEFPTSEDDDSVRRYIEAVVSPAIALIVIATLCVVLLCVWNCCLCKRLHRDGRVVPSERWARHDMCWHPLAWFLLGFLGMLWIGMAIGVTLNTQTLKTEVNDLPSVFRTYANFLETGVIPPFNCSRGQGTNLVGTSQEMLDDPVLAPTYCAATYVAAGEIAICITNQTVWKDLLYNIGNNSELFALTMGNVTDALESGVRQLHSAETETTRVISGTDTAVGNAGIILVCIVLLCGLWPCVFTARAAKKENMWNKAHYRQHTGIICVGHEINATILWLLLLLCAVVLVYLRGSAGFCADPFATMSKAHGGNSSDPFNYYVSCGSYTEAERAQSWPWESERREAYDEFSRLASNITVLQGQWNGNSTTMGIMANQSRDIGCTLTTSEDARNDRGILSPSSILSCQMGDRFAQDAVVRLCSSSYSPIERILAFLILLSLSIVGCTCVLQCLRREENFSEVTYNTSPTWDDHDNPTLGMELPTTGSVV